MDVEAQIPPGLFDAAGVIAVDHECKRCSYNLRGLREDGRCPECGIPIGLSTRGDLLRFSSPDWVDKVALGLKIILWMILVSILVGALAGLLTSLAMSALGLALSFLAALISFYGVWLMTEPDPGGVGEDPNITARKLVRLTLVIGLAGQAVRIMVESTTAPEVIKLVGNVLMILTMLVGLVGEFAKFLYYEKLALRIPDGAIARRARLLRWAYVIALGISVIGGAAAAIAAGAMPAGGAATPVIGVLVCVLAPALIAMIVFGFMTLGMLLKLRRAIAEQARLARATWAAALDPPETRPTTGT